MGYMSLSKYQIIVIALMFFAPCSYAENITVKISKLGCHKDTSVCFAYIDLGRPIETNCTRNDGSIRWDGMSNNNAASIMAFLLASQAQDKKVTFGGAGETCFMDFPSFRWVHTN